VHEPWLPKLLLQRRRSFRSPQLLHRVLILHEEAAHRRLEATITGACKTPRALERALAQALADDARCRAVLLATQTARPQPVPTASPRDADRSRRASLSGPHRQPEGNP
jgi:hypothetical protein